MDKYLKPKNENHIIIDQMKTLNSNLVWYFLGFYISSFYLFKVLFKLKVNKG